MNDYYLKRKLRLNTLKKLLAPISVNLEMTNRCNLNCFFCFDKAIEYQDNLVTISDSEKNKNIKKILDILAKNNIFEIRLFGGEFPLLKGWKDIVEYADKLNFFISFVSNGTMFNKKDINFLIKKKILNCTISVHGLKDLHDKTVGISGSFERASKNIKLLSENKANISVLFTPTKSNIFQLEEFAETMINQYGASSIGVNRLFRSDRYENLSFSDYLQLLRIIEKLQRNNLPVFFTDSFPLCKVPARHWQYMSNCSQGVSFCQIDYMGNIKNCSSVSVNIGNIFQENIKYIWQEKLKEFRTLKYLPLSCRLCPMFCGGGCIASRAIKKNFIPDEFIKLPNEETLFETIKITIKNYFKVYYNNICTKSIKQVEKEWESTDKPAISCRYKKRKEADNIYLCMIEKKGVVVLNERSISILNLINGENTIEDIERALSKIFSQKIRRENVVEVLNTFID